MLCCLSFTEPPFIKCNCKGYNCDDGDEKHCTLKSPKHLCYTILNREAGVITYQKGCEKNCEEHRTNDEIKTCCNSTKCNNEATHVWPSEEPPTSAPPEDTTVKPTTEDRKDGEILCHCSGCESSNKVCAATVGCLRVTIGSLHTTSCVSDTPSCSNDSSPYTRFSNITNVDVICCKDDYCNSPSALKPTTEPQPCGDGSSCGDGPPCDDEDSEDEQSGGCGTGE